MPRKTVDAAGRQPASDRSFNEAAAHAAENRGQRQAAERAGDVASMRPRPMPRKTAAIGPVPDRTDTGFNEAAAHAAENR